MQTLTFAAPADQLTFATVEFVPACDGPSPSWDAERYEPTAKEEAYDLGWRLFLAGEEARPPYGHFSQEARDLGLCFLRGYGEAKMARERSEARALGHTLGLSGSGICEPPAGHRHHEAAAYREGFAAGLAEYEAEYNEWLDSIEGDRERMEEAFAGPEDAWHPAELAEARGHAGHPASEG